MKNWLDKFQKGGTKSPIYTTNKSKLGAYKDSLNLYNEAIGKLKYWKENPNATNEELNQEENRLAKLFPYSPSTRPFIKSSDYTYIGTGNAKRGVPLYTKPTQPYILGREQEQLNYLPFNSMQEQPGQGVYPTPELLRGLQMVPYTRGTVQYPGGYQEKGYELVDKVYKDGGSPRLINVMDGYMPKKAVDNTATPLTPRTADISQSQLYALRAEGLRKREEEKREIEFRRQAEKVIDSGKGKFTLPTGETKDYSKMNFREKSYVKGEALKNRGRFFPDENNIIDDLNPLNWIGSMAGNMSQAPYVAQQTDSYMPYATAIAEPLLMGRAIGSGSINPFGKKFWTNSVSDAEFANSLLMGVPKAGVKVLSKLPFENVPILNQASKINPWSFKTEQGKIYRQIGKPGFEDALKEGRIYDKGQKQFLEENVNYDYLKGYDEAINAKGLYLKKPPPAPFFSKDELFFPIDRKATGKGFKKTANSDAEYLIEGSVPNEGLLPRYMDRYLKPGELSTNTFVLRPEYNNLENFNLYKRNWLEGYSKIKTPESLQNFKNIASDLKPGNFSRSRNIALNPVGIFKDYSSGLLKGAGEQLTGLMKDLRISSGNASRRPFFETFPITKTQKAKVSAMQDEALNDAMEFTKNYWYADNSENIRPVLEDKIRAFVPDIKMARTSTNLERTNPKNPFNTTEDLLVKNTTGKLEKEGLDEEIINYLNKNRGQIGGVNDGNKSITLRNSGFYYKTPKRIGEIVVHEGGHTAQRFGPIADFKQNTNFAVDQPWSSVITKDSPKYEYYTSNTDTELGRRFQKALVDPKEKNARQTWLSSPDELHSEMMAGKYNLYKQGLKQGYSAEEMMSKVTNPSEKELLWILDNKKLNKHFKPETSLKEKLSLMKLLPAAIPVVAGTSALQEKKKGGIIEDPMGQWKYPGQITRIPSSNITMQGVDYPVYGVDNNGQEQMMYPGQEYNFPGADYVDEYPMMKDGGLLSKSVTCSNCGWSWKGVEGGLDALTCHKCGGMIKMQNGGLWNKNKTQWVDSVNNANMMKNFVQREYLKNGPSIQVPGEPGRSTHLMAYDPKSKRVYPEVVNINGKLKYLPGDQAYDYADSTGEFITFPTAEQAAWYSNNGYKTGTGVTIGKKESGGQHGGLDRWFAEKWVDVKTGKECGRQEGENREGYPACRPSKRINADTPKTLSELSSAEKAKFKQEKTSSERINYNHKKEMGGDIPYDTMENFYEMKEGGNVPTNPSLWSKAKSVAKSKYDVYPSAYANGFAAKWYKERGGNWKKAEYGMEVMKNGGTNNPGFEALPEFVQAKILSNMGYGGYYNPMMANGGEPDGEMALGQIDAAINKLTNLRKFIQPDSDLEPWVSSKLTMVDDYANSVSDYMMYNPETQEMMELPLEEMKNGGIPERYKNMGFTKVGTKKQSTRPGKKWMVLAKKGDAYKVVHGGYKGMQDFKQHHSEQRRKNFWNRMGGKNSSKATDPFSPLYWHKRFGTWENGGQINQMQNGGIMMRDLQYPVYGMDRDLFNSRLQNGGNVNWLDNIN